MTSICLLNTSIKSERGLWQHFTCPSWQAANKRALLFQLLLLLFISTNIHHTSTQFDWQHLRASTSTFQTHKFLLLKHFSLPASSSQQPQNGLAVQEDLQQLRTSNLPSQQHKTPPSESCSLPASSSTFISTHQTFGPTTTRIRTFHPLFQHCNPLPTTTIFIQVSHLQQQGLYIFTYNTHTKSDQLASRSAPSSHQREKLSSTILSLAAVAGTAFAQSAAKNATTSAAAGVTCTPYLPGPGHEEPMVCQCNDASRTSTFPLLSLAEAVKTESGSEVTVDGFCGYTTWPATAAVVSIPSGSSSVPTAITTTVYPKVTVTAKEATSSSASVLSTSSPGVFSSSTANSTITGTCTRHTFTGYESSKPSPYVQCYCNGLLVGLSTTVVNNATYTVCANEPGITLSVPPATAYPSAVTTAISIGPKIGTFTSDASSSETGSVATPGATGAGVKIDAGLGMGLGVGGALVAALLAL